MSSTSNDEREDDEVEMTGEQAILAVDLAMNAAGEARSYAADEVEEICDCGYVEDHMTKGVAETDPKQRRREFAVVAMNLTEDRYGAGSTSAAAALRIALTCGFGIALDFVKDLQHHEER